MRPIMPLPDHLAAALGKGHARADVPYLVAALEAHGVAVAVRRVQLGDLRADGFGTVKIIYETETKQHEQSDI